MPSPTPIPQTLLVFKVGTSEATIEAVCAEHPGINGYFKGIPPFLAAQAESERWVLPYLWVEPITPPPPPEFEPLNVTIYGGQ